MRSSYLIGASFGTLVAVAACGGTAVVDGDGGGASGGTGGTTTTSSGGSTSVSSGCDCTTDDDCEQFTDECSTASCGGCACNYEPRPAGLPCSSGVCDGGGACVACLQDEDCGPNGFCDGTSCVYDVVMVCSDICDKAQICGLTGGECFDDCVLSLGSCSASELQTLAGCSSFLEGCDVDGWIQCVQSVGCLM